jgi:hypothetical protein
MTAQSPDFIIINNEKHALLTNPLEAYRELHRPDIVFLEDHPNTACWRGYVAEWEIVEGKLFLLNVVGNVSYKGRGSDYNIFHDKVPATLSEIFGNEDERVHATWFTGELRIPQGEITEHIHHGYGAEYSGYLIIPTECGVCGEDKYVKEKETSGKDLSPTF